MGNRDGLLSWCVGTSNRLYRYSVDVGMMLVSTDAGVKTRSPRWRNLPLCGHCRKAHKIQLLNKAGMCICYNIPHVRRSIGHCCLDAAVPIHLRRQCI